MKWKILDIEADNGLITKARYLVTAKNNVTEVSTEGWWHFQEPVLVIPFAEVKEEDVIGWIDAEASRPTSTLNPDGSVVTNDKHQITARLEEQLVLLTEQAGKKVVAPWLPQVFTPEI
jgi:hypothetical protein